MAKLILMVHPGSGTTKQIDLTESQTRIGRAADNHIVIDQNHVSRFHAAVLMEEAFFTIKDMGSRNGVFVNGSRIDSQTLMHGDSIVIGDCQIRFLADDDEMTEIEAMRLMTIPGLLMDLKRTKR